MTKLPKKPNYKEQWFEQIFNNEGIGILVVDKDRTNLEVNPYMCELFGYSYEELVGKNAEIFHVNHDTYLEFGKIAFQKVLENVPTMVEWQFKKKDGSLFWIIISGNPVPEKNEVIWTFTDITARKKIEQELNEKIQLIENISITDELSGLYNRRQFNKILEQEWNRAKRAGNQLILCIIDIDNFKQYNDMYGHQEGDVVIKHVSQILSNYSQRAGDFAFRIGGEEFAIIMSCNPDEKKESGYFEKIRNSVELLNIKHEKNEQYGCVTICIGVLCVLDYDNLDTNSIYRLADEQLYIAKEKGRNRVEIKNNWGQNKSENGDK